jgi:ectoine hydroxylase-related dioxygenase (phytanoyl-CoA dioxygenase family)
VIIVQPTAAQVAHYARDGFLVVQSWLSSDEVERVRSRVEPLFLRHEWSTGIAPDEVNFTDGVTDPARTRQLCNVWKADPAVAAVVLSPRIGRFATALERVDGMRLVQDNLLWKPPSGKALGAHRDAEYLDFLDPVNMTTCWMALDDTRADTGTIYYVRGSHRWPRSVRGGSFHDPDDWLAHARAVAPEGDPLELVPVEVPAGGAAFHHGWTMHGSPANERADGERRSVVSHLAWAHTRHDATHRHPIYSRYQQPGSLELDEAFFPVLWRSPGTGR